MGVGVLIPAQSKTRLSPLTPPSALGIRHSINCETVVSHCQPRVPHLGLQRTVFCLWSAESADGKGQEGEPVRRGDSVARGWVPLTLACRSRVNCNPSGLTWGKGDMRFTFRFLHGTGHFITEMWLFCDDTWQRTLWYPGATGGVLGPTLDFTPGAGKGQPPRVGLSGQ